MSSIATPDFERFVDPARPRAEIWRTLAGLCLIALIYGGITLAIIFGYAFLAGGDDPLAAAAGFASPTKPIQMFVLLATFSGMAIGTWLVARFLHKRRFHTLLGPRARVLPDFLKTAVTTGFIYSLTVAIWFVLYDAVPNLTFGIWLVLLPIGVIGLLIQTLSEELIFRGYLQQQLAARFSSALIWMLVPSILFGLAHYDPDTSGKNLWLILLATGLFGFIAADLTARTGSLGAAWGLHFANNFFAVLIIAVDGTLPGLALFLTPYGADNPIMQRLIWLDMGTLLITWLILRRVLRR